MILLWVSGQLQLPAELPLLLLSGCLYAAGNCGGMLQYSLQSQELTRLIFARMPTCSKGWRCTHGS